MCASLFPTNPLLLGPSEQVPRDAIPCCLHTERNGRLGKEEHFKTHGLSLTEQLLSCDQYRVHLQ